MSLTAIEEISVNFCEKVHKIYSVGYLRNATPFTQMAQQNLFWIVQNCLIVCWMLIGQTREWDCERDFR